MANEKKAMKTSLLIGFCLTLIACMSGSQKCPTVEPRTIFVRFVAEPMQERSVAEDVDAGSQDYLDASAETEEAIRFDPLNGDL
jgi:hypothetical protein